MMKDSNQFIHLKNSFPLIIRKIKDYIGIDRDFARLCDDFEEVSETIRILNSSQGKTTSSIQFQIASYRQLKNELTQEIESFIQEEQKSIN